MSISDSPDKSQSKSSISRRQRNHDDGAIANIIVILHGQTAGYCSCFRTQAGDENWPWNCARIANAAIAICRPHRSTRASARSNAHSAPHALKRCFTMSVPTVVAVSRPGRSVPRGNGGQDCLWRSARPQPLASIFHAAGKRLKRTRRGSEISHQSCDDPVCRSSGAELGFAQAQEAPCPRQTLSP